ncbi:MAG: hypothetical protein ACK6DA_02580 [Candidatus Kapaibacterium sp.]
MKHIFLTLTIILFLGCSNDDAPTNMNTASRSVADYIYDGPVGTQYFYKERTILTDTNDKTVKIFEDTTVTTILNRAYPHPNLGSCLQVEERTISSTSADTLYYVFNENAIAYTKYKSGVNSTRRLLIAPLTKGSPQDRGESDTSMIQEIEYPISTSAGNFSTVHVRAIQYYSNKVSTTIRNFYFAPNVLFCKVEIMRKRRVSSGEEILHNHYIVELFRIKKHTAK